MDEKQANTICDTIEAWWQDRRENYAMDTITHNRELAQVESLKEKIRAMIDTPAPEPEKAKK